MNTSDLKLLTKAYQFASFKHRFQKRKNGDNPIPYINHPI
jgi:(p)ppGpp synthase/HD superfamily hydrolase